ncbi:vWA domain-containing protein [Marinobacter sp. SS21]|uniref:vWA domain-containing protein n=1 Tax=Marinobacter sp. SS21 TaxID=2979460 RepID=UPI00232DC190|nr:vWA domain-containing protein [Marinobacter sp. SS21]MDC0662922.1 VWA domain-containing protein [Marinobacter sp. SS21]
MSNRNRNASADHPRASGKVWLILLALIVVAVLEFGDLFSDPAGTPATTHQPSTDLTSDWTTSNANAHSPYYALQSANYSWPPNKAGEISANLMAKNYYLVFDGSGSMGLRDCGGQDKLVVAKSAVLQFIDRLHADANIGLFVFDRQGARQRVSLTTGNRAQLQNAVQNVIAGGDTPLSKSIEHGFIALTNQAEKQLGYGEYHLVIITDGEASSGFQPTLKVAKILESSPVNIHTIGFCIDENHSLNQPGLTFYRAADDQEALTAGLNEVLAEAPDFAVLEFAN